MRCAPGVLAFAVGCTSSTAPPAPFPPPPAVPCAPGSEPRTFLPERLDWTSRVGGGLAFLPGPWPRLVVGAPSHPFPADTITAAASGLWFLDRPLEAAELLGAGVPNLHERGPYQWPGSFLEPLGDLDADGFPDLGVGFGRSSDGDSGTLDALTEEELGAPAPAIGGLVWLGGLPFRCGDVDGDGFDDLCLPRGLVRGPMTPGVEAGLDLEWGLTFGRDDEDETLSRTRMLGVPGGLLLADADGHTLYRLVTFPAGGVVDLAANADARWSIARGARVTRLGWGDLDGDGVGEVLAAVDEAALLVGPPAGGGALADARTTLPHAVEAFVVADFDGDGSDDLAVGGGGEVGVFLGPLAAGEIAWGDADLVLSGLQPGIDRFGSAVAAYDWDGDGRAELAVGAPDEQSDPGATGYDAPLTAHGRATLYCGGGLP